MPGTSQILIAFVEIVDCVKIATITDVLSYASANNVVLNTDDGTTMVGASFAAVSFINNSIITTSASFVGIDLGTAVSTVITINTVTMGGPSGAVGVNGASSSANLPVGATATFRDCNFVGDIDPITGIAPSDIRWDFSGNDDIDNSVAIGSALWNGSTATTSVTNGTYNNLNITASVVSAGFNRSTMLFKLGMHYHFI